MTGLRSGDLCERAGLARQHDERHRDAERERESSDLPQARREPGICERTTGNGQPDKAGREKSPGPDSREDPRDDLCCDADRYGLGEGRQARVDSGEPSSFLEVQRREYERPEEGGGAEGKDRAAAPKESVGEQMQVEHRVLSTELK